MGTNKAFNDEGGARVPKTPRILWGLWVEAELKTRYKELADEMGVGMRDLAVVALKWWLREFETRLYEDDMARHGLADRMRQAKRTQG